MVAFVCISMLTKHMTANLSSEQRQSSRRSVPDFLCQFSEKVTPHPTVCSQTEAQVRNLMQLVRMHTLGSGEHNRPYCASAVVMSALST